MPQFAYYFLVLATLMCGIDNILIPDDLVRDLVDDGLWLEDEFLEL